MIHLIGKTPAFTLCGLNITKYIKNGLPAFRKKPLQVTNNCNKHECDRCHVADEHRQVVQYAADCKAAGVPYGEL